MRFDGGEVIHSSVTGGEVDVRAEGHGGLLGSMCTGAYAEVGGVGALELKDAEV